MEGLEVDGPLVDISLLSQNLFSGWLHLLKRASAKENCQKGTPPPGRGGDGGFLFAFFPSPAWVYPWPCLSSLPLNEECHNKAWDIVNNFMVNNVQMFCGTALNGISTIMPEVSFWVTSHLMMWQKLGTAVTTWWSSGPTCPLVASFQLLSWIL